MATQKPDAATLLAALKPQQRKFVEAFCASFNATQAAKEAGYSEKTARQQGSRLLTIVDICAAIKAVLDTSAMEPEEIAARWTRLARAGLDDFYTSVQVQWRPTVAVRVIDALEQCRLEIGHIDEFIIREGLSKKDAKPLRADQAKLRRQLCKYELEESRFGPEAQVFVAGPAQWKEEKRLDLVKAAELGLLDLVKAITPTEFGNKLELRSPDEAMGNLAKWRGMFTNKVDVTSGGAPVAGPSPHDLAKKLTPEQLAHYQAIHEALAS